MGRKSRLHRAQAFYHVMLRGNNGQQIFFSNQDYYRLCLLIQQGTERFGYQIHGFCFMTNHIHLVLQMGEQHISRAIQHLALRYSQYINRKEKRIGHLFQGRFKAILVEDQKYLLKLIRYVNLNPVHAGLVSQPEHYKWSGHRTYLDLELIPWLCKDEVLRRFDSNETSAKSLYVNFILQGIGKETENEDLELGTHQGRFLGSEEFVKELVSKDSLNCFRSCTLSEIINSVCKELGISNSIIVCPTKHRASTNARGIIGLIVKSMPELTLKEYADFVGHDQSAISRLIDRTQRKLELDPHLEKTIKNIKQSLNVKCQA